MNAVWVRHAANVEDAEEALNQMRADERLAKMAVPISVGNSDAKLMEGRIVLTLRFGTVKEAEGTRDALVAAGYNACLRQCLSLDGKNQWVRRVSFPKRVIEAAGGSVHLAALLQEQWRQEYDSALTVTAKGGSNGERSSFVFKFSSLAGVEKARETRTVYVNQLESSSFEIKAQPFITRVGQTVIRTGGAGQPSAVDLDIQAIKEALSAVVGKGGSTEVWGLEDGTFCFRVLPLSMGLAIASKGTLRVNGLLFPIELCFAANSAVSYPKEEQPTANALLKQWLVSFTNSLEHVSRGSDIALVLISSFKIACTVEASHDAEFPKTPYLHASSRNQDHGLSSYKDFKCLYNVELALSLLYDHTCKIMLYNGSAEMFSLIIGKGLGFSRPQALGGAQGFVRWGFLLETLNTAVRERKKVVESKQ
jgi:hypothetical protein